MEFELEDQQNEITTRQACAAGWVGTIGPVSKYRIFIPDPVLLDIQ